MSELGPALIGLDRVSREMHMEPEIGQVWSCTQRPLSIEVGHAHGGRNHVNMEATIKWDWRYIWRQ
jgi:hypothetical protein